MLALFSKDMLNNMLILAHLGIDTKKERSKLAFSALFLYLCHLSAIAERREKPWFLSNETISYISTIFFKSFSKDKR
jgi:hypothetical protein